jgi:hypothetical protein
MKKVRKIASEIRNCQPPATILSRLILYCLCLVLVTKCVLKLVLYINIFPFHKVVGNRLLHFFFPFCSLKKCWFATQVSMVGYKKWSYINHSMTVKFVNCKSAVLTCNSHSVSHQEDWTGGFMSLWNVQYLLCIWWT